MFLSYSEHPLTAAAAAGAAAAAVAGAVGSTSGATQATGGDDGGHADGDGEGGAASTPVAGAAVVPKRVQVCVQFIRDVNGVSSRGAV